MSESLARALAAPPAAQPMGSQDMLARILMGTPDPGLPQYPVMQSAEGRGFAPMPTSMGDMGARMGAVLRGQVEPTPGERYGMDVPLGWVAGSGGSARDGIRAYHGSPHQFDRFDMSRIGTGEGAQAYGHGLYFAGNEGVARSYRDALSSEVYRTPKGDIWSPDNLQHLNVRNQARQNPFELGFAISRAEDLLKTAPSATRPMLEADLATLRALQDAGGLKPTSGSMYEVRLNTTPDRLLDWDAPLAQQSIEARNIANTIDRVNSDRFINNRPVQTGADIWRNMRNPQVAREFGYKNWSSSGPAEYLRDTGIDGIQYLDAGSRAAGDGTRNYVMFDDSLIDILRRYGLAGMLAGGAASQAQAGETAP